MFEPTAFCYGPPADPRSVLFGQLLDVQMELTAILAALEELNESEDA